MDKAAPANIRLNTNDSENEGLQAITGLENHRNSSEEPLLYVDVNLGNGERVRIAMYEDSDPAEVATQFAIKHKIRDDNLTNNLVGLLKS